MKEVYDKSRSMNNGLPKMMVIDGRETFDQNKIANGFNKFFTDIGSKLACFIPSSLTDFKDFEVLQRPIQMNAFFKTKY